MNCIIFFHKFYDIEKLSIKSPQFIQMENENEALKFEVGSMRNEFEEVRGLKELI
ncbi:hypothetical protein [Methanobrevibacter sp.]|uniref:hypothetical protein n=1 Tax=Methanobrevibacter sp. TaxID=66852 RepID=UPI00388EECCB